jgi:hypothetical protein
MLSFGFFHCTIGTGEKSSCNLPVALPRQLKLPALIVDDPPLDRDDHLAHRHP